MNAVSHCNHGVMVVDDENEIESSVVLTEQTSLANLEVSVDMTHPNPSLLLIELRRLTTPGAQLKFWTGVRYESQVDNTQDPYGLTQVNHGGHLEFEITDSQQIGRVLNMDNTLHT